MHEKGLGCLEMERRKIEDLPTPVEIKRIAGEGPAGEVVCPGVQISWSDGVSCILDGKVLRLACPCATCEEERGNAQHARPLSQKRNIFKVITADTSQMTTPEQLWAIGNYAIGIKWQDGHDSGIYSFTLLRNLCEQSK